MKVRRISILGCGWFGLPLAIELVANGYEVRGSARTESKVNRLIGSGIKPFILDLNIELNEDEVTKFLDTDLLIISIPPSSGMQKDHLMQIQNLFGAEKNFSGRIIYISSTSVYLDNNSVVNESDKEIPTKGNGKILRATESWLTSKFSETIVLRFGGLLGKDRNPVRYFAGKKSIEGGKNPVNLIHLDDCIGIVLHILSGAVLPGIYNACSPEHPEKQIFYEISAKSLKLEPPHFINNLTNWKIVSPQKLVNTGYNFIYPSPETSLQ